ncbi:MAG: GrpB family protein [Eggerthellaceae bacterium]|nr:GrpB family protein [Eggerthellaceae bacterium]
MPKDLSQMTLEELWQLFPIFLVEHSPAWERQYDEMADALSELLSDFQVQRISHIGSTAIDGIMAKDIVDILVELPRHASMEAAASALERAGFIVMFAESGRISLNRGYTPDGFADEVFHVHLRYAGDNDELYFRDYLNEHPEVAREYEALKLALWKRYEHNRDAYTEAKTDFIASVTARAKVDYAGRY